MVSYVNRKYRIKIKFINKSKISIFKYAILILNWLESGSKLNVNALKMELEKKDVNPLLN